MHGGLKQGTRVAGARKKCSAQEKIRIVLDGLFGEDSIAEQVLETEQILDTSELARGSLLKCLGAHELPNAEQLPFRCKGRRWAHVLESHATGRQLLT